MCLPAEAKEEEQRQTGLVRLQAAGHGQGDTRGVARSGRILKSGTARPGDRPAVTSPHQNIIKTTGYLVSFLSIFAEADCNAAASAIAVFIVTGYDK